MKIFRCIILSLYVLYAVSIPVCADMIWEPFEPWGDDIATEFYHSHDTDYEDESYLCDSYDGTVTAYASPEDLSVMKTFKNWTVLRIYYIWHGEDLDWGLCSCSGGQGTGFAWVPMDELAVIYNAKVFREEHADEIFDYDGSYDNITSGYLWTYPHSGNLLKSDPLEINSDNKDIIVFQELYVDEDGGVWCYIVYDDYRLGLDDSNNGWMYVTDPLNAEVEAIKTGIIRSVSQENGGDSVPSPAEAEAAVSLFGISVPDAQSLAFAAMLVIAVTAVTAVLIVVFWRRKR